MDREFDINLLFEALDRKRESQELTWAGVAREIGIAASTIRGIRDKGAVEGDGALRMLLWLDRSPESFVRGFTATQQHQLIKPENAVLRFDVKKAYGLVDAKRLEENLSWDDVADQIGGFRAPALKRFEKGGRTSIRGIMRIADWLNVPARELTRLTSR